MKIKNTLSLEFTFKAKGVTIPNFMDNLELEKRLENGLYGKPQLKADEKRKYLSNFRERVIFIVTFEEMQQPTNMSVIRDIIKQYPQHQLYLNSQLSMNYQRKMIQMADEEHCSFTVIDTSTPSTKTNLALVYASKHAMNIENISLPKKQTPLIKKKERKKLFSFKK